MTGPADDKNGKKESFLINFLYYALLLCAAFVVLKYGCPAGLLCKLLFILASFIKKTCFIFIP